MIAKLACLAIYVSAGLLAVSIIAHELWWKRDSIRAVLRPESAERAHWRAVHEAADRRAPFVAPEGRP